jgi:hypothetical protein
MTERKGGVAMKKIGLGALLLSVFGLANTAFAAGHAVSASMQVSFVVQEACTVQAPDGAKAAPTVACAHAVPVQVAPAAAAASAAGDLAAAAAQTVAGADGRTWQITF